MSHDNKDQLRKAKEEHLGRILKRLAAEKKKPGAYFPNVKYELAVVEFETKYGEFTCVRLVWHDTIKQIPAYLQMDVDVVIARDADGYFVNKNRFDNPGARVVL